MVATPSGTGGSPAAVHSSSPHASAWAPTSGTTSYVDPSLAHGVHDARISIWAVPPSSAMPPKLSVATRVTVPDAAT